MSLRSRRRVVATTLIVTGTIFGSAVPAHAAIVTLGPDLSSAKTGSGECGNDVLVDDAFSAPAAGTVTSWSAIGSGVLRLRVVRPDGGGGFVLAGTGQTQDFGSSPSLQTFSDNLLLAAGDRVGVECVSDDATVQPLGPGFGGSTLVYDGGGSDGSALNQINTVAGIFAGFAATLDTSLVPSAGAGVGPPDVTSLSPASGLPGTAVVIKGHNFNTANQVLFGTDPATFVVDGFEQITAIAPAGAAGPVDVTVMNSAGKSATSAADVFTRLSSVLTTAPSLAAACPSVPKLVGHTRHRVPAHLALAHCKAGVTYSGKGNWVQKQSPKAGSKLADGAKIKLKLGKHPPGKKKKAKKS